MTPDKTALRELLKSMYGVDELVMFLTVHYPEVVQDIPTKEPLRRVVVEVVEVMGRRGLLDERLCSALVRDRGEGRRVDIEALWTPSPADEEPLPDPSPEDPDLTETLLASEASCSLRQALLEVIALAPDSLRQALVSSLEVREGGIESLVQACFEAPMDELGVALVNASQDLRTEDERRAFRDFLVRLVPALLRVDGASVKVWVAQREKGEPAIIAVPGLSSLALAESLVAAFQRRPARFARVEDTLDSPHRLELGKVTAVSEETSVEGLKKAAHRQYLGLLDQRTSLSSRGRTRTEAFYRAKAKKLRAKNPYHYVVVGKEEGLRFAVAFHEALKDYSAPPVVLQGHVQDRLEEVDELLEYLEDHLHDLRALFPEMSPR